MPRAFKLHIAFALCVLVAVPPAADAAEGSAVSLVRTDRGQAVAPEQLEAVLTEAGVLARLKAGSALRFFGQSFTSAEDSTVYLGAAADMVHAVCLKGKIRSGDASAGPGQLLLWRPGGDQPEASDFNVARFLATSTATLPSDVQRSLDALVEKQKSLIFWGALERTNRNARALTPPLLEPTRREYLRRPSVIGLRLAHNTAAELARATAQRFVDALKAGEAETVADLLNPGLFVAKGRGMASGAWRRHRRAFAAELVRQPWRARLTGETVEATGANNVWFMNGTPTGFAVTLSTFDAMTFVTGVKPATTPPTRIKERVS